MDESLRDGPTDGPKILRVALAMAGEGPIEILNSALRGESPWWSGLQRASNDRIGRRPSRHARAQAARADGRPASTSRPW